MSKKSDLKQFEGMTGRPDEIDLMARHNFSLDDATAVAQLPELIAELKKCYEEIDWMKGLVKNLYRLLHDADEDMAYAWAVKHVGEEDMWVVRGNASE